MRGILSIILLITFIFSSPAFAHYNTITVSSTPISQVIKLITGNDIKIEVVSSYASCPHEYILKPSDLNKIQHSQAIIILNRNFEFFMGPLIKQFKGPVIDLSYEIGMASNANMHIWLSMGKDKEIIKATYQKLIEIFPEYQEAWKSNMNKALSALDSLIQYKRLKFKQPGSFILLSDSIEYLFDDLPHIDLRKLYRVHGMISAKTLQILEETPQGTCILIDKHEDYNDLSLKSRHKILAIESEDWSIEKYKRIIDTIAAQCR